MSSKDPQPMPAMDHENTKSSSDIQIGEVRIDLHCHSVFSHDSVLGFRTIAERARALGLQGVAITDHNTIPDKQRLADFSDSILLLPGCEVSTAQGHLLVYGLEEAPKNGNSLSETIQLVKECDGIPILSHPFRLGNGVGMEEIEALPDVLFEGLNGRSWMRYNRKAMDVGKRLGRKMTGGSDAHDRSEVGRAWTVFPEDVQDVEDVLDALRRKKVEPGGRGLSFPGLVHSKLKGTIRWTNQFLGRGRGGKKGHEGQGMEREGMRLEEWREKARGSGGVKGHELQEEGKAMTFRGSEKP